MATHKTYREILNGDIKNIYAGHNSNPPKLTSGFASRYFGTRLLQTLFSTHAKPTDAFQWNSKCGTLPRISGSAGPAFRTFEQQKIDELIRRLRKPTASSEPGDPDQPPRMLTADNKPANVSCQPRQRLISERKHRAVFTRIAKTHTHVSKIAAERDVNRVMREINSKIPSDSVYFLNIK